MRTRTLGGGARGRRWHGPGAGRETGWRAGRHLAAKEVGGGWSGWASPTEEDQEERPAKEALMSPRKDEDENEKHEQPSLGNSEMCFRFNREETFMRIYLYTEFIEVSFCCL